MNEQHESTLTNMPTWELKAAIITSTYYGVPWGKISWYMSICPIVFSQSLLYEFLNLSTGGLGPILISLWHDHRKPTEEWKLHFARKCLDRKRCIKHGKMNKALWLARFFKMQMLIGCGTTARKCPLLTDSLAIPGHTYAYAWKWLFYLHFFAWWFPFWHISIIQFTLVW